MLDDEQRVAALQQNIERLQEALRVARMQAERRLVEDVADAVQAAAELRRQPGSLELAAAQGRSVADPVVR